MKIPRTHTKSRTLVFILLSFFIIAILSVLAVYTLRTAFRPAFPVFYTHSPDLAEAADPLSLPDCYITNKVTYANRYFIDSQSTLWGYGRNEYGQLGMGDVYSLEVNLASPVKIAEHVVSVDCSINSYFCIYLTENGELYGMGSNMFGLLGQDYDETYYYGMHDNRVTRPVLLMEQVAYARAGRECIAALKKDGSVWWWGQYMSTYGTNTSNYSNVEKTTEDESNPSKMLYTSPHKILDNCVYVTTGDWTGAAISEDGGLYTWGLNIFGECGTPVTGDDYIRTPCRVLEDVRMVWPEQIELNSPLEDIPERMTYETQYDFNTFVQLKDGNTLAAGHRLGETEKTISLTGDMAAESTHAYSDTFVPVEIKKYSEEEIESLISQLEIGTDRKEVEAYLTANGIQYFDIYNANSTGDSENLHEIRDENQKYFFYFDSENKLTERGILNYDF